MMGNNIKSNSSDSDAESIQVPKHIDGGDKELLFLILSAVSSFIIGFVFFLLSLDDKLTITLFASIFLFILFMFFIARLKTRNMLSLTKSVSYSSFYLIIICVTFFIESNYSRFNIILVLDDYIHLGDKELDWFDPPKPLEQNFFTGEFNLRSYPKEIRIRIYIKDVDPDVRNGPAIVKINGKYLTSLNELKPFSTISAEDEHEVGFQWIEKTIPMGHINEGKNSVSVHVLPTIYGYDDINFSRIEILYR